MKKQPLLTFSKIPTVHDNMDYGIFTADNPGIPIGKVKGKALAMQLVRAANSIEDIKAVAENSTNTLNEMFSLCDTLLTVMDKLMVHLDDKGTTDLPANIRAAAEQYKAFRERNRAEN